MKEKETLEELIIEHQKFAMDKFPESTWVSSLRGLEREIKEVEIESKIGWKRWVTEYVDCAMYLFDSMHRAGVDMDEFKESFWMKMQINKYREWVKNKDGSYSHLK